MKSIRSLLCFLCVIFTTNTSNNVLAFQDDYVSVDSRTKRGLADLRQIYNSPKSLCRKTYIRNEHCGKVSIGFGGTTFASVFYDENLAKHGERYFDFVDKATAEKLRQDYMIPTIPSELGWVFPTLGQLTHMINNNYVYARYGNPYWYWDTKYNELRNMYWKSASGSSAGSADKAHLSRVVTKDYPSSCAQDSCPNWVRYYRFTLCMTYRDHSHNYRYRLMREYHNGSNREVYAEAKTRDGRYCYRNLTTAYNWYIKGCHGVKMDLCWESFVEIDESKIKSSHSAPMFCIRSHYHLDHRWWEVVGIEEWFTENEEWGAWCGF